MVKPSSLSHIQEVLSSYEDPRQRDYDGYLRYLGEFNRELRQGVIAYLQEVHGDEMSDRLVVTVTGSDGRYEKAPASSIEMMVIAEAEAYVNEAQSIVEKIHASIKNIRSPYPVFSDQIEIKPLEVLDRNLSLYYHETRADAWPSRVLDALAVAGNSLLLVKAKAQMLDEFQGKRGRGILDDVKSRHKEYRGVSKTGRGQFRKQTVNHYDLEKGIAFYNPTRREYAFKYGPNRMTQMLVMSECVKMFRKALTGESGENPVGRNKKAYALMHGMPTGTTEKLKFLLDRKALQLQPQAVEELMHLYEYFLWQQHQAEYHYLQDQATRTSFDKKEVQDKLETLLQLTEHGLIQE